MLQLAGVPNSGVCSSIGACRCLKHMFESNNIIGRQKSKMSLPVWPWVEEMPVEQVINFFVWRRRKKASQNPCSFSGNKGYFCNWDIPFWMGTCTVSDQTLWGTNTHYAMLRGMTDWSAVTKHSNKDFTDLDARVKNTPTQVTGGLSVFTTFPTATTQASYPIQRKYSSQGQNLKDWYR